MSQKTQRPKRPRKPRAPKLFVREPIELVGNTFIEGDRLSASLEELIDCLPDDVGLHEIKIQAESNDYYDDENISNSASAYISACRETLVPNAKELVEQYNQEIQKWKIEMVDYRKAMDEYHNSELKRETDELRARLAELEIEVRKF